MKSAVVVFLLATSLLGQSGSNKDARVTGVAGESWLNHLHRALEETSMGKTGRLGPSTSEDGEETAGWQLRLASESTRQTVTVHGSDLYRLNCQGCHGEFGLGAPPEINSVINPTRATSVAVTVEKMKKLGMEMSRADATELANQSKASLLQRLHKGGTDMPPFPHLSEPEVRAIYGYLKLLAEVPGAEKQQATLEESPLRVGEHIVKSTCHICHNAAGPNPNPEQLLNGAIPPLSSLTTRTTLAEFERKLRSRAPIMMGTPLSPYRGRMPVFYYLREDEVADAYLYLSLNPPYEWAVLDPVMPAPGPDQAARKVAPGAQSTDPTSGSLPVKAGDTTMASFPVAVDVSVVLLLLGGMWFTVREIRRLTAKSEVGKLQTIGPGSIVLPATHSASNESRPAREEQRLELASSGDLAVAAAGEDANPGDKQGVDFGPRHADHLSYESSWLARRLEKEERVA